ncbi:replicase polyprotein 1a [Elysia marginata]|uniref:Replicase polyprotein 1a n=1 Tax=Elysia marginata TaxID=1093978 RepID=A0AAV4HDL5_9GAST|nr:replicase polyprotein 1a [Elysia marginata]
MSKEAISLCSWRWVVQRVVNEFPDFLVGQERTNTQQIAVTYTTCEPRRRSLRRSKRSPRGSQTELNGDRSNASTPLGYSSSVDSSSIFPDDAGYGTQSSGSLSQSRPTSRGSIKASMQAKKKKKALGLNDSWDHDSILRSLKEIEEDTLEDIEEDRLSVIKSQGPSRTGSSINKTSSSRRGPGYPRELPAVPGPGGGGNGAHSSGGDGISVRSLSQQSIRPLPPMPKTGAFETVIVQPDTISIPASSSAALYPSKGTGNSAVVVDDDDDDEGEDNPKGCSRLFSCCGRQKNQVGPIYKSTTAVKKEKEALGNQETGRDGNLQNGNPNNSFGGSQLSGHLGGGGFASFNQPPSRGSSMRGSRSNTPIIEPERNLNELNVSSSDLGRSLHGLSSLVVEGLAEKRKCVLNLYILNLTSPLLMLIRSAWNNYIIVNANDDDGDDDDDDDNYNVDDDDDYEGNDDDYYYDYYDHDDDRDDDDNGDYDDDDNYDVDDYEGNDDNGGYYDGNDDGDDDDAYNDDDNDNFYVDDDDYGGNDDDDDDGYYG